MKMKVEIRKALEAFFDLYLIAEYRDGHFVYWIIDKQKRKLLELMAHTIAFYEQELRNALDQRSDEIANQIRGLGNRNDRIETFHQCCILLEKIRIDSLFAFSVSLTAEETKAFMGDFCTTEKMIEQAIELLQNISHKVLVERRELLFETLNRYAKIESDKKQRKTRSKILSAKEILFKLRGKPGDEAKANGFCDYLINVEAFIGNLLQLRKFFKGGEIADDEKFDWNGKPTYFIRLLRILSRHDYAITVHSNKGSGRLDWDVIEKRFTLQGENCKWRVLQNESGEYLPTWLVKALDRIK